jgi:isoamylase
VEGPTDDQEVIKERNKQKRNLLTTMFLSQGVPMLVAGDEIGRTQQGNNNAYCQDNEISWVNWANADKDLLSFTSKLIHLRKKHPVFRRRRWFQGQPVNAKGLEDIAWFLPEGMEMEEENWNHDFARSLGVFLNGKGIHSVGPQGEHITDDNFYVIFNAHHEPLEYKLPEKLYSKGWTKILDTSDDNVHDESLNEEETIHVQGRSVVLLQHRL